jgi:ankyrin repeat protein
LGCLFRVTLILTLTILLYRAEVALSYILAWDPDLNVPDSEGLRPLHLAVKACEDIRSTRSIKHLLIRGAQRNVKDSKYLN